MKGNITLNSSSTTDSSYPGEIERFRKHGIPDSSLRQWLKDGPREIFTLPELELDTSVLVQENMLLKSQVNALQAKYDLSRKSPSSKCTSMPRANDLGHPTAC